MMFWLLLGGGILWVGYLSHKFHLTGWDIRVVVEEGKCHWIQGVSQRDREAYESFFVRDLAVNGRLEVFATKESNGRLRMKVKGIRLMYGLIKMVLDLMMGGWQVQ